MATRQELLAERRRRDLLAEKSRRQGLNTDIGPEGEIQAFRRPEGERGVFDNPNSQLDALLGNDNLDDFMPFGAKFDFGRIIQQTTSPADTEGRIKMSILYKSLADIGPRIAFDLQDELNKIIIGRGEPIKPSGAWKQIKDQYQGYIKELSEKGELNIPKSLNPGSLPFTMSKHLAALASEAVEDIQIPTIYRGIKEMVTPSTEQTKEEKARFWKEYPERLLWMASYIGTLGGRRIPTGAPEDTRKILLDRAEEYAGFAPALGKAGGDLSVLAIEWGAVYPALFRAVGLAGKAVGEIPQIVRGSETIKKLGGLNAIAKRWPRVYARTANIIKAFAKGAGVGTYSSVSEDVSQGMEADDILQHAESRALLMGGVASLFQAVSEVDTALYISKLRKALIQSSNQRIDAKIREIDARPNTLGKRDAMQSLGSLKKLELQAIDKIVSATEANLLRLKGNKLYQLGQESVENPQRVAERFIKYGFEKTMQTLPKGAEVLKKGLGKGKPFIEMPMTRVSQAIEVSKSIAKTVKHPIKAFGEALEQIPAPQAPTAPKTPPPVKGKTAEKIETPEEVEAREFKAEVKEMNKEIEQQQAGKVEGDTIIQVKKGLFPQDVKTGEPLTEIRRPSPFPTFDPSDPELEGIAGFFTQDDAVAERFTGISKEGVVGTFNLQTGKIFEIDAKGKKAGDIEFGKTNKEFKEAVRSGKYDTIVIKNTSDEGDVIVALKPENIEIVDIPQLTPTPEAGKVEGKSAELIKAEEEFGSTIEELESQLEPLTSGAIKLLEEQGTTQTEIDEVRAILKNKLDKLKAIRDKSQTKAGKVEEVTRVKAVDELPPVPEGKLRLYHGTVEENLDSIAEKGLLTGSEAGKGEKIDVVLFSTEPGNFGDNMIVIDIDEADAKLRMGTTGRRHGLQDWGELRRSVKPSEITAIIQPSLTPTPEAGKVEGVTEKIVSAGFRNKKTGEVFDTGRIHDRGKLPVQPGIQAATERIFITNTGRAITPEEAAVLTNLKKQKLLTSNNIKGLGITESEHRPQEQVSPVLTPTPEAKQPTEKLPKAVEEEFTPEEREAKLKIDAEIASEDAEVVHPDIEIIHPEMYIGKVTQRAKNVWGEQFGVDPKDVHGFKKGGFPTKRTEIAMTKGQAREAIAELEEWLIEALENNQIRTENQLALANAQWGNIVEMKKKLGEEAGPRPFKDIRAKKHKSIVFDPSKTLSQMFNKAELIEMADDLGIDSEGTKAEIAKRLEEAAEAGMSKAQKIVAEAKKSASEQAIKVIKNTKSLIWRAVRGTTIDPAKITVGELLGTTMRRMAQAARKAYAAGKAEVRALIRQQKIVARQKKALKKRANKAIATINKNIPKSVDFFYREAIQALQDSFTPGIISKKKLDQRRKSIEFFNKFPDRLKEIPASKWKKLLRKPLNDLTLAELEDIAEDVKTLTEQGKLKRGIREKQAREATAKTAEELTEAIGPIDPDKVITVENAKVPVTKKVLQKIKAWTWRPSRIFDLLDGMKNFKGRAHDIFINAVNKATNTELRMVDKRKDAGLKAMESLDITLYDLAQVREVNGVRYSVDEMIGVYAHNKNRLGRLAIRYGNNLSDKDVNNVVSALSENEKAWGDAIIDNYGERYEVLRRAVINLENRDMGQEENYTPIRRLEVDHPTLTDEVVQAVLQREGLRRIHAQHGFTLERKDVPKEFQKPVNLGITNVWFSQLSRQEHYIHFGELIRDLHRIADNKDFRSAIESNFGKEFVTTIDHYIDMVANPSAYKSYNALENLSRKLRQHAVIAYLSYNLVTMTKQLPSLMLYLPEAGAANLFSSIAQFASNPKEMIEMVKGKDPQVAHRSIERELEELRVQNFELHQNLLAKFGRAGLEGIYFFDSIVRTIGWNAVYQNALPSMGEAGAVQHAQNVTLRTQPAAAAKDLARLYTTNEFANWFTMFTNQLNQLYNIATYDMRGYLQNEQYREFAAMAFAMSSMALMIWIITHRRLPEDESELADAAAEQIINAVPLIGKSIMAGKKGWGGTEIPSFEAPKAVGKSIDKIIKGDFDDSDIADYAEGIAVLFGIPYTGVKRIIKVAETGELKELVGGKPKK